MTWYNACTEGWAGRKEYGSRELCEDGHSSSWRTDPSQLCCAELPEPPIIEPPIIEPLIIDDKEGIDPKIIIIAIIAFILLLRR